MKKKKIGLDLFEITTLAWMVLAILGLTAAIFGFFYPWLIASFVFIEIAIIAWLIKKKYFILEPLGSNDEKIAIVAIIFIGLMLANFTIPTIFGGRDQGSISNAAILLAKNHNLNYTDQLVQEFGKIYGEGKALNFPGFNYKLIDQTYFIRSQFLPGYISWVAIWYALFGITGIAFANLLPFVSFLFSFYLVSKFYTKENPFSLAGLALLAYSFPIFALFKFTLTEIFFASFLWTSLHFLFRFIEEKNYQTYLLIFLPLLITPFIRIEAIAVIFTLILILIFVSSKKLTKPKYQLWIFIMGLAFAISVFVSPDFFADTGKNFASFLIEDTNNSMPNENDTTSKITNLLPDDWKNFYLFKVLFNYNIAGFIIMGSAVIIALFRKKFYRKLIPFFFLAPTLIYLFDANISLDHPWMLRRFAFSIIPLFILYSIVLFESISFRFFRFAWSLTIILFLYSYLISAPFATFGQNQGLFEKTGQIGQDFAPNDLILISRLSTGNGWNLISEPLRNFYNKQAIYFFNPNDLAKINYQQFTNVYLITSTDQEEISLYSQLPKEQINQYDFANQALKISQSSNSGPEVESYQGNVLVFKIDTNQLANLSPSTSVNNESN